ncbi:hypothetical protein F0562_016887 [Nyssa sinensis]|uniref:Glycosyltransferase N-terminal domain-containing protein n=1 Tax=Nyssa sinensis TaxID=561372 RepID=A0A5J4ZHA5_9ASTE|nr:hypothetical protein F0562_016887 [Nyssa sinensis]
MASQSHQQLHFLLIPLMSQGHLIPMIDIAKLLAQHGVIVTIVTTPLNAIRFSAIADRAIESGLPIRLLQLRFPSVEAGLPEGCETVDAVPSRDLMRNFYVALYMLQQPLEEFFEQLKPTPNCIIADKFIAWAADTAKKFQIPRILFDGMNCFTLLCMHNLHISKVHETVSESEPFVVPGLPDHIEFTRAQLPATFNPGTLRIDDIRERIRAGEAEAYGVVVNSFEELEPRYVNEYQKVKGDKIWCIGPLSLYNKDDLDKAQRGNKASIDEDRCLKWLDSWQSGSVVYACLGSLSRLTPPQLIELGLGLEASNRPFIWVMRGGDKAKEMEEWIQEVGFEERTKGRGLLIRGWAPQVLILSHPAIGGFLTHCGWNSTLEGVCAGVPMITWPMFAEQFFNEKLVVKVLDIGVSVGAQFVVHWSEEDKFGVTVTREAVRKAVDKIMDGGEEGEERRRRARELGEKAKRAVEGGSSHLNVTMLIQDIMQQANKIDRDTRNRIRAAELAADGVVVNSFEELEPAYVEEFRKVRGSKVWCIGPVSLCNKENVDRAKRGNKASIDESKCLKWLDSKEPSSVVYACLGSLSRLTPPQLIEFGLGLEASNRLFIWVIREGNKSEELEKWILEEGYEERTRGRGLLICG